MEHVNEAVCGGLNGQAGRVYKVREREWALGERMTFPVFGVPGGSVLWDTFSAINVSFFIYSHRPSSRLII